MFSLTRLWQSKIPDTPAGAPQLTSTHLLVATRTVLYAFRLSDGSQDWQYHPLGAVVVGFQVAGERLLLTTSPESWADDLAQGVILDVTASGRIIQRWAPAGAQQMSLPVLANHWVWVVVDNQMLYSLNIVTGREALPPHRLARPVASTAPLFSDHALYLPGRANDLLAVTHDGRLRWLFEAPDKECILNNTPVLVGDYLISNSRQGQLFAVHTQDGRLIWQTAPNPAGNKASPLAANANVICMGSNNGLYGLEGATGKAIWHFPSQRSMMARPVIMDDVVYAAGHDHFLYALDIDSGRELWRHNCTPRRLEQSPVFGYHHGQRLVAVVDQGGTIITFVEN